MRGACRRQLTAKLHALLHQRRPSTQAPRWLQNPPSASRGVTDISLAGHICNSTLHHKLASLALLWGFGGAWQQLCFPAGLQKSWEMPHMKGSQAQAATSAAWHSYPRLRLSACFRDAREISQFQAIIQFSERRHKPHQHLTQWTNSSKPSFRQIPQGHATQHPSPSVWSPAGYSNTPITPFFLCHLQWSMHGIIKINIVIGRLKTSSTQFWINTLRLATPLQLTDTSPIRGVSFNSPGLGLQLKAQHNLPFTPTRQHFQSWDTAARRGAEALTWLMELAAQEARPVPREASRKQGRSNGTGAMAKPADAVLTTRAATQARTQFRSSTRKPSHLCTPLVVRCLSSERIPAQIHL